MRSSAPAVNIVFAVVVFVCCMVTFPSASTLLGSIVRISKRMKDYQSYFAEGHQGSGMSAASVKN